MRSRAIRITTTLALVAGLGIATTYFASTGNYVGQVGLAAVLATGGVAMLVRIYLRSTR